MKHVTQMSMDEYRRHLAKESDQAQLAPEQCSAAGPLRKGKDMVLMFQSACSGLWYYNYQAAGDVSAVRVNGEIFTKQTHIAPSHPTPAKDK